ncbi:MAG: glycosyltransferase family 4 protein [Nitrososphaeria archaeon]
MLSWEYPPNIIGGIARHVDELSRFMSRKGVDMTVVTPEVSGSPLAEVREGVKVIRVQIQTPAPNFYNWIFLMNHFFSKKIAQLVREQGPFDIVHGHDWMVVPSACEAKHYISSELVLTFHSLEFRRSLGSQTLESRMIESLEWWGSYDSSKIVVCSSSMARDVRRRLNVDLQKIRIIPNGIDPERLNVNVDVSRTREKYGVYWKELMILFVGRLTSQKGCEYLIRALPKILEKHNVKLVVVGDGPSRSFLESEAYRLGLSNRVIFAGFVSDQEMIRLMKSADVLVVPSIYEPFGIVALEGMAAGVPVVASDVDGLAEIIKHEENGVKVYPQDPSSISWGVDRVLSDYRLAERLRQKGKESAEKEFSWSAIADRTIEVYKDLLGEGS